MEWNPIESAPRDETPFLAAIWIRVNNRPRQWRIYLVAYDGECDEMDTDYESGWDLEDYTHWMPLPEPPNAP